jgi:hypothetical protein
MIELRNVQNGPLIKLNVPHYVDDPVKELTGQDALNKELVEKLMVTLPSGITLKASPIDRSEIMAVLSAMTILGQESVKRHDVDNNVVELTFQDLNYFVAKSELQINEIKYGA